jgi:hypothetical protein
MYRPQTLIVRALHRQRMRKFFCAFDRLSQYVNYHTSKDLLLPSSQTRKLSGSHWLHLHLCVPLIAASVNTDSSTQSFFINSEEHHMIWLPVKECPAETRQRIALQRYAAEKSLRRDCSGRISWRGMRRRGASYVLRQLTWTSPVWRERRIPGEHERRMLLEEMSAAICSIRANVAAAIATGIRVNTQKT